MEHRPCDRCGNQNALFFDDEPNAPYCLGEAMRQVTPPVEWPDARVHPVILPPPPFLVFIAMTTILLLGVLVFEHLNF